MKPRCKSFLLSVSFITLPALPSASLQATTIADDGWVDGVCTDGVDPLGTNWWTSTSSSAIEMFLGFRGIVPGTSGSGFGANFAPRTLAIRETITAKYTFTTPTTIRTNKGVGLRVGIFAEIDESRLEANLLASSDSSNLISSKLLGYMADCDVKLPELIDTNISIWEKEASAETGRPPVHPETTSVVMRRYDGFVFLRLSKGGATC